MPSDLTPNQRLAEKILQRPLSEYINEKRTARPRWSWSLIAEQLAADTEGEVTVSHEAIRQWYRDDLATAS